ncbi:uncharacterized protein LOC144643327 [Oculina patagonica]
MPEIRQKVYDPDKNKSYTKAKAAKCRKNAENTGFFNADRSSGFINFPTDDSAFNKDFSVLPVFVVPTDTLEYLKECGKATKKSTPGEAVAEISSTKGLRLLSFVHDMQVSKPVDNSVIYVRALCWASYRKNVKYKVRLVVNPNGKPKIIAALCDSTCPAGKSGCCCHVMAVIWKLDEISRNKLLTNQCEDDRPCTSKPRKWGIPGKRTVMHEPIMASQMFKPRHQTDLPGRKRRGVLFTFYDPRPAKSKKLDPEAVENFRDAIFEANPSVPFGKMTPNSSDIVLVDSLVGKVAKGSVLHLQMKDFTTPSPQTTSYFNTPNPTITSERRSCLQPLPVITNDKTPSFDSTADVSISEGEGEAPSVLLINQPLSLDEIRKRCQEIKRNLFVNEEDISKIERETKGQSTNDKWFDY